MKALKSEEVRTLTDDELNRREQQYRETLFKMRMKAAVGQLTSVADVKTNRQNLARIMTEVTRRRLAAKEG